MISDASVGMFDPWARSRLTISSSSDCCTLLTASLLMSSSRLTCAVSYPLSGLTGLFHKEIASSTHVTCNAKLLAEMLHIPLEAVALFPDTSRGHDLLSSACIFRENLTRYSQLLAFHLTLDPPSSGDVLGSSTKELQLVFMGWITEQQLTCSRS